MHLDVFKLIKYLKKFMYGSSGYTTAFGLQQKPSFYKMITKCDVKKIRSHENEFFLKNNG